MGRLVGLGGSIWGIFKWRFGEGKEIVFESGVHVWRMQGLYWNSSVNVLIAIFFISGFQCKPCFSSRLLV
jgi:hypothetical protein